MHVDFRTTHVDSGLQLLVQVFFSADLRLYLYAYTAAYNSSLMHRIGSTFALLCSVWRKESPLHAAKEHTGGLYRDGPAGGSISATYSVGDELSSF